MEELRKTRGSANCYANTNVLINKLDIKDYKELAKVEKKITILKSYDLRQKGINGNFDMEHLKNIHRYLFEDLYYFAGEFRTENIAKDNFRFADFEYLEGELKKLLDKLKEENYLIGMDKDLFVKKLAYYTAELNVLHPFREGNGRTIREFIRQLTLKNNYEMNLKEVDAEEMLQASKISIIDTSYLEELFEKCLKEK